MNSEILGAPDSCNSAWVTVSTGEFWVKALFLINEPVTTTSSMSSESAPSCWAIELWAKNKPVARDSLTAFDNEQIFCMSLSARIIIFIT